MTSGCSRRYISGLLSIPSMAILERQLSASASKDQRHIKLQQARNHLHGTGRRRHAGTAQYAAVLLCNLAHGHTGSGTKRAAGIGRNSKNRNRGKCHTNKIGARIGRRDSHIAGTRTGSRLGSHNGSARILRRAGDNKDGAAGILIDIRRVVGQSNPLGHRARQSRRRGRHHR